MKKVLLIITILAPFFAMAQTEEDMFDISSIIYSGNAKSAAMGNAMGAVGSDFSAIAINPAGLGLYRHSTLIYSPEFFSITTDSKYKNGSGSDRAFRLPTNSIGLTWTQGIYDGPLNTVSFGIGINRLNNYSYNSYVSGDNWHTSLVDAYFNEMFKNGIHNENDLEVFSPNSIYPLWETYLIDFDEDGSYSTPVPAGGLSQQYGVTKKGDSKEFSFATGLNFNDRTFFGVSVNVPYFDKSTITDYKETNLQTEAYSLRNWTQQEIVKNSGVGISAKIGAIVYPARWVRLGAAFHTPAIYKVDESWYTNTRSVFSDGMYEYTSPTGTYSYTITTPLRLNASAAFIFGNFGMISADCEYVDYSQIRVSSYDYDYTDFNGVLRKTFKGTSNIRIGTEWRWQTLAFRAGYAIYGSPYGFSKTDLRTDSYSCGLGYTYHRFTIDAAYVLSQRKNSFDLYSQYSSYPAIYLDGDNEIYDETKIKETTNINQVVISFKFRLD